MDLKKKFADIKDKTQKHLPEIVVATSTVFSITCILIAIKAVASANNELESANNVLESTITEVKSLLANAHARCIRTTAEEAQALSNGDCVTYHVIEGTNNLCSSIAPLNVD